MPTRLYSVAPFVSRLTKKPRPWMAASIAPPVVTTPPSVAMLCVVGDLRAGRRPPAIIEEKLRGST
jgi:hypothetical protein